MSTEIVRANGTTNILDADALLLTSPLQATTRLGRSAAHNITHNDTARPLARHGAFMMSLRCAELKAEATFLRQYYLSSGGGCNAF